MPSNPGPASDLQIWEVARATSAAPLLFPEMKVQGQIFVDGGLTTNNPCQDALRDVAFVHHDKLKDTCLVSIGSGIFRDQRLPNPKLFGRERKIWNASHILVLFRNIVTQTETTDTDIHELSLDHGFPYFRFNPDLDRDISLDEWTKQHGSNGSKKGGTLRDIDRLTDIYLENEKIKKSLRKCASAIVLHKFQPPSGNAN